MAKTKQVDPDIAHEGSRIILPSDPTPMTTRQAIETLERKAADDEIKLDVHEQIDHHPHDALVAFCWAMKETYGWFSPQTIRTFFGDINPDMITVKTGPKDHEFQQLPSGRFKLPNVSEPITVHLDFRRNALHVVGEVRKADKHYIVDLCNKARERLRTHSIFRSKAIRLPCDDDGDPEFARVSFIETDHINVDELILNPDELEQVQASLWTPIRKTEECVRQRIPLNRGVLLEGVYGTGKSMTANVTSRVCVENGWTFILLDDVRALKDTLLFAQRYQPCVIFAEDIDRVAEERDQRGNDILNTIDGILTKNSQVITVLTTNFVDKLDRAMLRPGRLDAVVSIRPPEEDAVKSLIRLYGHDLVDPNDDLSKTAEVLAGQIPATIREVVERSKLGMIGRGNDKVTDDDLYTSAVGMTRHLQLLQADKPAFSKEHNLGAAFKDLMVFDAEVLEESTDQLLQGAAAIDQSVRQVRGSNQRLEKAMTSSSGKLGEKVDEVHRDVKKLGSK